ncbi:hypothetical protein [Streptomyces sp. NPDC007984]|uniref:hypothetical protein n=1 Tax=Streptomyces sp. NPDC007984 TaxID=3364801 RepID=UPI0036E7BDEB
MATSSIGSSPSIAVINAGPSRRLPHRPVGISEIVFIDGFELAGVGEVEDVAFGDGAVVPGFGELVFGGVVGELVEGGVVVVGCCLAVLPPGVAFIDAGVGQGDLVGGSAVEWPTTRTPVSDSRLTSVWPSASAGGVSQMRIVIWTLMSGCRLRKYRW